MSGKIHICQGKAREFWYASPVATMHRTFQTVQNIWLAEHVVKCLAETYMRPVIHLLLTCTDPHHTLYKALLMLKPGFENCHAFWTAKKWYPRIVPQSVLHSLAVAFGKQERVVISHTWKSQTVVHMYQPNVYVTKSLTGTSYGNSSGIIVEFAGYIEYNVFA